ncbi:MAG TPA: hypothetical protein VMU87_22745 [Stellaceae bacterium]|nr:hypothetical protein [Stellaceae bacterium]
MNRIARRALCAMGCAVALGAPAWAQQMGGGGGGGSGGSVSSIATACGASGGPITTSGTIATALLHNTQSGTSYALAAGDCGKLVTTDNASSVTVTLLAPATAGNGYWFEIQNLGAGTARLTPASGQINGAAYLDVIQSEGVTVASDGSDYFAVTGLGGGAASGVSSFDARTGAVTLEAVDVSGVGGLLAANNLADLANAATARSNLGLAAVAASGSASDLGSGTLPAARLPAPGASTLGGVASVACGSGQFVDAIGTSGSASCATPSGGGNVGTSGTLGSGDVVTGAGSQSVQDSGIAASDLALLNASQSFARAQRVSVAALTDGATITPDCTASNNFTVTLGGNRTLANFANLSSCVGQSGHIMVVQDATGSRTLSYGSDFRFPGGTAATLTTTPGAHDMLSYYVESSALIDIGFVGDFQ